MIRALALTAAIGLSPPAWAQSDLNALVQGQWGQFLQDCVPVVQDPVALRETLPLTNDGADFFRSLDGRVVDYSETRSGGMGAFGIVIEEFKTRLDVHCTLTQEVTQAAISADVAKTVETILAQTPELSFGGGDVVEVSTGEPQQIYSYLVDGAFPGREAYLYILVADGILSFDLHFNFPLDGAVE